MRDLKRNQKTIYYALYSQKVPILDDEGFDTGETKIGYGNPVELKINVSASKGETEDNAFGKLLDYDKSLSKCDLALPIDEQSILWIDVSPVIKLDGTTDTKHDYKCVKVAKSLNSVVYAVKKVV